MPHKITYPDKILDKASSKDTNKLWRFEDANEVKDVVNFHADEIEALEALEEGATYTEGTVLPTSPKVKDQFYDTDKEILYKYIDDGTSSLWMDISSSSGGSGKTEGSPIEQIFLGEFESQDEQEPTGLGQDNSIIVNFGDGGLTIDGEFFVESSGAISCLKNSIQYHFEVTLRMVRSGSGGVSELLARMMYAADGANYVQIGSTFGAGVDDGSTVWRERFSLKFSPAIGSKIFIELARNNSSNNSGGLGAFQPSGDLDSWNPINSSSLKISKTVIQ